MAVTPVIPNRSELVQTRTPPKQLQRRDDVMDDTLSLPISTKIDDEDLPIKSLAISKRRVDFDKSFGNKSLFHFAPFVKDHCDEDAPDSAEEIDESWK